MTTLPDNLQDEIAKELLDEIDWELQWDSTLKNTQTELDMLAQKALKEFKAGKTVEKGFDNL